MLPKQIDEGVKKEEGFLVINVVVVGAAAVVDAEDGFVVVA
jgi:hypothetical protein